MRKQCSVIYLILLTILFWRCFLPLPVQAEGYGADRSLPPQSPINNMPRTFYEVDKTLIWSGVAFTATVSIVSLLLVLNIRRRKQIESALREREGMLSMIINAVPQAIFWKDINSVYLGCNRNFAHAVGLETEAAVNGKTDYDFLWTAAEADKYRADDRETMQSNRPRHHTIEKLQQADGSRLWIDKTKLPLQAADGSVIGILGVFENIEERRRAEEALRESEERLRVIFETSQSGIIVIDTSGRISFANRRMEEMFRCAPEYLIGSLYLDHLHISQRALGDSNIRNLVDGTIDHVYTERHYIRKDGSDFWGYILSKPLEGPGGSLKALVGTIMDITELKSAHDELKEEKERLAVTLRSIGDGVISVNTDERVVMLNKVAEKLCGWSQEDAEGQPLGDVFRIYNEVSREPRESPVKKALATGKIVEIASNTILVARDGNELVVTDSAAPIRDWEGRIIGVVLVFRDMTEKRKIEEELFKARKLESLGVLAGGIAHDFNNLLTGILGNISLAKLIAKHDDKTMSILNAALKATERATDLTSQLLTFSKGGAPIKKLISIAPVLKDSATFALRGSNVLCEFAIDDELWTTEVDVGQMSQVINNLVINANQAMPDGGVVTVKAENIIICDREDGKLEPGDYIRITIADRGIGIAEENLQRIFDPYFTTKPSGNGLGLATVYSIIRNHCGQIEAFSKPGQGTSFVILLPASVAEPPSGDDRVAERLNGQGRILVMDDEEVIREVTADILKLLGYEPTVCGDGVEALYLYRLARTAEMPFDAVIMDLTVPGGMGGKEAVSKLLEIDSEARVIVSSGYSNDPILANYRDYGFRGAIIKPYRVESLSDTLNELMSTGG